MSPAELLARLSAEQQAEVLAALSDEEAKRFPWDWRNWWARPTQLIPPGLWTVWLILAGRGFGKTRTGAEAVREEIESGRSKKIALVAPTAADVRDVMVEGVSGIMAISPPNFRPHYEPSKSRLTWPNGAMATTFSADEPERLRGPAHDFAWCDELGSWRYPEAWDMLQFGLREGSNPRVVVTTTPKPIKIIRELLAARIELGGGVRLTTGSTYANRANLAPKFFRDIVKKYEGTRLGRQELNAEMLDDVPGALWQRDKIDLLRCREAPPLKRVVVAIDPAVTSGEEADETGIIVAGVAYDDHVYVLDDQSGRFQPQEWAAKAIELFIAYEADLIVGEVNNGGDMIGNTIHMLNPSMPFKAVRATRGKVVRAEPVSMLYEQDPGSAHHVGFFGTLEDQMCAFTTDFDRAKAGYSPDRVDALVWAVTELMVAPGARLTFA